MMDRISIVIPVYKDHEAVKKLIYNINNNFSVYMRNIIFNIVDDTPDNSIKNMIAGIPQIFYHRGNGNYGDSLITGIMRGGFNDHYNRLIIMDIDHPFNKIFEMIDMLHTHDMVIGNDLNENRERKVTKYILNKLFGINVLHPTCGFMGFTSEVLGYNTMSNKTIHFWYPRSKKDIVHVELLYMCIKKKLNIGMLEFDTINSDVKHNYSIKRNLIWLKDVINMFLWDKVLNWYNQ
jgi:hypothetical protein